MRRKANDLALLPCQHELNLMLTVTPAGWLVLALCVHKEIPYSYREKSKYRSP